ncbi:MAG: Na+:H+ antiporter, NhaA family [Solirubrobacteraceae bacterium]|jgi:NhaA family Na+:H+ antiporter|nr:Na+:H+ antiporter, NhaA family [Solirubrobacteraceae bacterium]
MTSGGPAQQGGPGVKARVRQAVDPLVEFLHEEAAGGLALLAATIVALVWANSPLGDDYVALWEHELTVGAGSLALTLDLRHWVNDALMALFFFVVGLEIKRELVTGELREPRAAALPAIAAIGGVALPVLIFLALTAGAEGAAGWAIPAATDIAFAVGLLALLGDRVSAGVRLLLLTIAIVDDIVAISIIAVFYSGDLSVAWLAAGAGALAAVVVARRAGVTGIGVYAAIGAIAWIAIHESGVHATAAGVALGLLTPARAVGGRAVLQTLEYRLHPISAFLVVPLFALANAGVDFGGGVLRDALGSRLTWAVVAGLVVGKLAGISGATLLALRTGAGRLPDDVSRREVVGVAAVAGIGFTVSLFVAQLAFDDPELVDRAKVGIFIGSALSGLLGVAILSVLARRRPSEARRR